MYIKKKFFYYYYLQPCLIYLPQLSQILPCRQCSLNRKKRSISPVKQSFAANICLYLMPQSFINASDVVNAREYMMHRCSNILDDRDEFYPFCLRSVCGQTKTNDSHKHRHTNTHTQKHGDKPRLKYTHTQIKQAPTQVQTHTHTTPLPLSVSEPQWGVQRRGHHSESVLQTLKNLHLPVFGRLLRNEPAMQSNRLPLIKRATEHRRKRYNV